LSISIPILCVRCGAASSSPISLPCPHCGFDIDDLTYKSSYDFINRKQDKHTALLRGDDLNASKKNPYVTSFIHSGYVELPSLVKLCLTSGHDFTIPSSGGRAAGNGRLIYVPETIGSGVIYAMPGMYPASGVVMMSPASLHHYGHTFPGLDSWINAETVPVMPGMSCTLCGRSVVFGHPFCDLCYKEAVGDWRNLI
jgi:ribosomal protein L37E